MDWRKSTYSGTNGSCVEVATAEGVAVRDTTDRDGGTLIFTLGAWQAFLGTLRLEQPTTNNQRGGAVPFVGAVLSALRRKPVRCYGSGGWS
jgi:hypothetical protein